MMILESWQALLRRGFIGVLALGLAFGVACGGEDEEEEPSATSEEPEESAETEVEAPPPEDPPPSSLGTEAGTIHTISDRSAQAIALLPWREERWMMVLGRTSVRNDGSDRTLFHILDRNADGTVAYEGRAIEESNYSLGEVVAAGSETRGLTLAWLEGRSARNGTYEAWVRRRRFDPLIAVVGPGWRVYREADALSSPQLRGGGRAAIALGTDGNVLVAQMERPGRVQLSRLDAENQASGDPVVLTSEGGGFPAMAQADDGSGVVVWVDSSRERILARRFDAELSVSETVLEVGPCVPASMMRTHGAGRPRVDIGPGGEFMVAWGAPPPATYNAYRMVLMARQFGADDTPRSDAAPIPPAFPLTMDSKFLNTHSGTKLEYREYDVAVGPGGAAAVVFLSSVEESPGQVRQLAIYVARYSSEGERQGRILPVAPVRETNVVVRVAAATDETSRLAVAWVAGPNVLMRVYDVSDEETESAEEDDAAE